MLVGTFGRRTILTPENGQSVSTESGLKVERSLTSGSTEGTANSSANPEVKLSPDDQAMIHYVQIGVRCARIAEAIQAQVKKGVYAEVFIELFQHELKAEEILYERTLNQKPSSALPQ